ncbi:hypothetical protein CKALI_00675 [Corynebacterium kalinowskii]|uniref:Uncharacterized protein n=1 Tax=Corynebacterium kalinowskii TaxID=2675216 RepID=A0A6B8VQI5_9CORY|nr:hypothetical protein [Corynebacterium kalinowskii]QGU01036.1 hypothetical protein CKALI_00675 [Corynebacterium kalinowskii]
MDIKDIIDFLGAISAVLGAGFAFAALLVSRQANGISREAKRIANDQVEEEKEQNLRAMAASIQAWYATSAKRDESREWAVIIRNEGPMSGVLYDLDFRVISGMKNNSPIVKILKIKRLPPGSYFAKSVDGDLSPHGFEWPLWLSDEVRFAPITSSDKYFIEKFSFKDHLMTKWEWDHENGLRKVSSSM